MALRLEIRILLALRGIIDVALHSSISHPPYGMLGDGFGRCADYAILGSRILKRLTGGGYHTVAGSEMLNCHEGKRLSISADRKSRRTATHLSPLSMFHCWIEAQHLVGTPNIREEIIDFIIRHAHATANQLGISYTLAPPSQPFQWIWRDELRLPDHRCGHPRLRNTDASLKTADVDCTRLLHAYEVENPIYFSQLEASAMERRVDQLILPHAET
ncbi:MULTISPECIES: hypothetical protein [Aquitalea]|uniref:hypothetical protein n=1 Tax=Aquitalea TaxID=407217 RepID=UPI000F5AC5E6|nr:MULTISPECIES: hypothetical protein [Aquitalea]